MLEAIHTAKYSFGITAIGFFAGILVGVTSIGSGSVILLLLLVFYGFLPALMVGTDIVHAVILAGLTGILQFGFGNVDMVLVACVLVGSIPGGLLGAYLTTISAVSPVQTNAMYDSRGCRCKNVVGLGRAC